IPSTGGGAQAGGAAKTPARGAKLDPTKKPAAEGTKKTPDGAAPVVARAAPADDLKAMASLIRSNERLAISLASAAEVRKEIEGVYRAGVEIGYFPALPSSTTIYDKPLP